MGLGLFPIVQCFVEDDHLKAIGRHLTSYKITCYHAFDEKAVYILSLHFVPSLQSAVCILYPVCNSQSFVLTEQLNASIPHTTKTNLACKKYVNM